MSDLLPPNASAPERALSDAITRIADVPVVVRQVWNADTCPVALLPWLAWAMSVDEWDANWTEAQKREVIRQSIPIHQKKGTVEAVKRAINAVFGDGTVVEWFEFGGTPHTFKIRMQQIIPDDAAYRRLVALVTAAKPLRSHLAAIQVIRDAELRFYLGFPQHVANSSRVRNRLTIEGADVNLRIAFAHHHATTMTVAAVET